MALLPGWWAAVWAAARFLLRQVLRAASAAVLVVTVCSTLLCLVWLATDLGAARPDVPYAWAGMIALGLAMGLPVAVVFGLTAAPLSSGLGRLHPALAWLTGAGGGLLLVALMTTPRLAGLGVLGGLTFIWLSRRPGAA